MVIPGIAMSFPVAGTPMNSPSCRPARVNRQLSRSPSMIVSWMVSWQPGNAAKVPS
jgi:hypothetical protein